MSSIYRKGRDGYFYYQKYLINPETGKKDKKIFHSLGTKDEEIAKRKQIEYDLFYKKKKLKTTISFIEYLKNIKNKKSIYLLIIIVPIIILFFFNKEDRDNDLYTNLYEYEKNLQLAESKIESIPNTESKKKEDSLTFLKPSLKDSLPPLNKNTKSKPLQAIVSVPKYSVVRVEKNKPLFKQIKVHITLNKNTESNSLIKISELIRNKYFDTTNIIICFYSDDLDGQKMAKEGMQSFNAYQKKECWLAMYSYNNVEGEYFDDEPTRYLGEL